MSITATKQQFLVIMRSTTWEEGLSPEEVQTSLRDFVNWIDDLKREGTLLKGQPLHPEGRVLRASRENAIADGPFVETKEAVGGYLLLQADSLEDAVTAAKRCPVLRHGMQLEIRTVAELCPLMEGQGVQFAEAVS